MMIPTATNYVPSEPALKAGNAHPALPATAPPAVAASAAATSTATKQEDVRREQLDAELADANRKLAKDGNEVRFEYDRGAGSLIVRLIDTSTKEILRQFPSNEALHAARMVKSGKPLISSQA